MRLNEITEYDGLPVTGYGPGFFRVAGEVREGPLLVACGAVQLWHGAEDIDPLLALEGEVDVILFGTGVEMAHVPRPLRDAIEAAGIGIEPMASAQACRSYNLLLSEGRRVALAALPV